MVFVSKCLDIMFAHIENYVYAYEFAHMTKEKQKDKLLALRFGFALKAKFSILLIHVGDSQTKFNSLLTKYRNHTHTTFYMIPR